MSVFMAHFCCKNTMAFPLFLPQEDASVRRGTTMPNIAQRRPCRSSLFAPLGLTELQRSYDGASAEVGLAFLREATSNKKCRLETFFPFAGELHVAENGLKFYCEYN